jgi:hypothetical protein
MDDMSKQVASTRSTRCFGSSARRVADIKVIV